MGELFVKIVVDLDNGYGFGDIINSEVLKFLVLVNLFFGWYLIDLIGFVV